MVNAMQHRVQYTIQQSSWGCLGPLLGPVWGPLGPPGGLLAGSGGGPGALLGASGGLAEENSTYSRLWMRCGIDLDATCAVLRPPWSRHGAVLGLSWAALGPLLGSPGPPLEPSWGFLGSFWGRRKQLEKRTLNTA